MYLQLSFSHVHVAAPCFFPDVCFSPPTDSAPAQSSADLSPALEAEDQALYPSSFICSAVPQQVYTKTTERRGAAESFADRPLQGPSAALCDLTLADKAGRPSTVSNADWCAGTHYQF